MINKDFIKDMISKERPNFTDEEIEQYIGKAIRLLGNLIHYKNKGVYENEDILMTIVFLLKERDNETK